MKLGIVVDGGRAFISELLADWQAHYETEVFSVHEISVPLSRGRVNQWWLRWKLKQFLQRNDVVFFEWAGPMLVVASRLPHRAKMVTRLHSYELYDFAPHIRWESVDRVILVSDAMRRRFCTLYAVMAEKTSVVYYGKSIEKFQPRERQFAGVLGMLCNLVPIKRVYEVILALYELNQTGAGFTLRLGGAPGQGADNERYYAALQRLAGELRLQDQVFFDGQIADPAEFLNQIDIFISNSYWEGQQNALLEAMAAGCYCLSHFWDGADEVLPRSNLFLTSGEMENQIVAYSQLLESQKITRRAEMRAIAEEKFEFQRISKKMRQILEELSCCKAPDLRQ